MILYLPESTEGISAGQTAAMVQDMEDDNPSATISCVDCENDSN